MPIETDCQGCGQRLRVADEHAGKKARCPNCQAINPISGAASTLLAASSTSDSPFASAAQFSLGASEELWTLKIDDGRTFGPVARPILDEWFRDGRITPTSQLQDSREQRWLPATHFYPTLAAKEGISAIGAARNDFADRELANPYAPPAGFGAVRTWSEPHNGGAVLTLGIVGIALCVLLGPVAAYLGHSSLRAIREGRMDPAGHGLLLAGTILGWIGTVQLLGICGCFGFGIALAPNN